MGNPKQIKDDELIFQRYANGVRDHLTIIADLNLGEKDRNRLIKTFNDFLFEGVAESIAQAFTIGKECGVRIGMELTMRDKNKWTN